MGRQHRASSLAPADSPRVVECRRGRSAPDCLPPQPSIAYGAVTGFVAQSDRVHVMVTRTDRMGDMILTAPLFEAVKRHFPNARLSALASAANVQMAALLAGIDAIEVDPVEARDSDWAGTLTLARRLRQLRIDVILFANSRHRLAVAAWLARIPIRIGHAGRGYSLLYTERVPRGPVEHETDTTLRLLEPLGIRVTAAPAPHCTATDEDRQGILALLNAHGLRADARIAVLHASNSGNALHASPRWYAQLCDALTDAGYAVVLTGTAAERELIASIAAVAGPLLDLSGRLTVGLLTALLQHSALCIGSSTGPTHLAAAVGTATVGLYAPLVKQQRWVPRGPRVTVLRPEVGMICASCLGQRCPHFNCMDLIGPERIIAAAARLQSAPEA